MLTTTVKTDSGGAIILAREVDDEGNVTNLLALNLAPNEGEFARLQLHRITRTRSSAAPQHRGEPRPRVEACHPRTHEREGEVT